MVPPPPVVQGQVSVSTGIGCTCLRGDVTAGGVLHPGRELAGDGGDDARAREHRTREPARQPGGAKQRRVGAVHGEHERNAGRRGEPGRHPPVRVDQVGAARPLPRGRRAEARARVRRAPASRPAPGARPPWCHGRPGSRGGGTRSARDGRARRRPLPRRPAPRRSARRPARRRRGAPAPRRACRGTSRRDPRATGDSCGSGRRPAPISPAGRACPVDRARGRSPASPPADPRPSRRAGRSRRARCR